MTPQQAEIMSYLYQNPTFLAPTSITKIDGGTETGSVADIQDLLDGNVYQLAETSGVPGFEVEFNFQNLQRFFGFVTMLRYDGSAQHEVSIKVYNYATGADDAFLQQPASDSIFAYRTVFIPTGSNYIDGSGNAKIIVRHESSGNASHDLYVDYVAVLGRLM